MLNKQKELKPFVNFVLYCIHKLMFCLQFMKEALKFYLKQAILYSFVKRLL